MRISDCSSDVCSSDLGAVHLVDPPDRGPRLRVVEPVPRRRLQQQRGVVVALLDVAGELTGLVEQPTDAGHRIGAEEGEAERLVHVPGELVHQQGAIDLDAVLDRVEGLVAELPVGTLHEAIMTAKLSLWRSEEHTSELQSLMRISYAVFCLK